MDAGFDFLQWIQSDMALEILSCLEDPSDLIRVSSVSRFWRHFVITNGLCKQLCMRIFPQLRSVVHVLEPNLRPKKSLNIGSTDHFSWEALELEHTAYSSLYKSLSAFTLRQCISDAIGASSTDNYPQESIVNTLIQRDRVLRRASYWSSKGQRDPAVPETLTYKLTADMCVINEINIQPFQAFFQPGQPIYSASSVRFRCGHPKSPCDLDLVYLPLQQPADDKFIWTYVSQEFPMVQENRLQNFKLPEPVLCVGGYMQIELMGRVQRQEMDGLFYICVAHVQIMGRPLYPAFDVEILEPCGKFALKYDSDAFHHALWSPSDGLPDSSPASSLTSAEMLWGRLEGLVDFLIDGEPFDPVIDGPIVDEPMIDDDDNNEVVIL